jgi:hypothetical protein
MHIDSEVSLRLLILMCFLFLFLKNLAGRGGSEDSEEGAKSGAIYRS